MSELGMYARSNPDYPRVQIGEFELVRQSKDKIWITNRSPDRDGEGGEFSEELLAAVIRAFYHEHF